MLVLSQIPEQHWESLEQEPLFAMQQVPLLQVWPPEQQVAALALPHT